jgi:demethylmenaquinone methyltransferase/2-methoxy-6-polyprenyl-1,4-benzoquinol methylase
MVKEERDYPLKDYYSKIYRSYDRVNRIFTFGRDVSWRKKAARECLSHKPERVLDLCTGTGDFLLELARQSDYKVGLTGYDFSAAMLQEAERKYARSESRKDLLSVDFLEGDVQSMPFPDHFFDAAGITFGMRNLVYENSNASRHLAEINRVIRPGGKLIVLESSRPDNPVWRFFNSIYLQFILPYLGGVISGNLKAYRYLAESSKNYYSIQEMGEILETAGFTMDEGRPLFLGSVMLLVVNK